LEEVAASKLAAAKFQIHGVDIQIATILLLLGILPPVKTQRELNACPAERLVRGICR
jgi:hypothetical protein